MIKTKLIKSGFVSALLFILISLTFSCESTDKKAREICECFEIRLEIKKMIDIADEDFGLVESERFKTLSEKKEECFNRIEPQYFEEKEAYRNGKDEKEFLLEELGDCEAVRELLNADKNNVL